VSPRKAALDGLQEKALRGHKRELVGFWRYISAKPGFIPKVGMATARYCTRHGNLVFILPNPRRF